MAYILGRDCRSIWSSSADYQPFISCHSKNSWFTLNQLVRKNDPDARNIELDGLRGLAAMAVALGHCNTITTGIETWEKNASDFPVIPFAQIIARLGHVIFPADSAVIVFFVMSGYVLWASLGRKTITSIFDVLPYMLGRFYRLLPVAIVTTMFIGFALNATARDVFRNALLLNYNLNVPLWTLQIEVVASFLLFFVYMVASKKVWLLIPIMIAASFIACIYPSPILIFLPPFVFGISLHYFRPHYFRYSFLALIAYIVLISADLILHRNLLSKAVAFIAAWLVVGFIIQSKPRFLRSRIALFLGDISYSFYLSHRFGLLVAEYFLKKYPILFKNDIVTFVYYVILSLVISLPFAWFIHVLVEKPGLQAGSKLRKKVELQVQKWFVYLKFKVKHRAMLN